MSAVIKQKAGIIAADYKLNDDHSYMIKDGDFVVTSSVKTKLKDGREIVVNECDQRHVEDILISSKGNWRFNPLVGVNIARWLNGPSSLTEKNALRKNIQAQLEFDVFTVASLNVDDLGKIEIETIRKRL